MPRINNYLDRIRAAESEMCNCGQTAEMMGLFLFRCTQCDAQRDGMGQLGQKIMGNFSFFVGERQHRMALDGHLDLLPGHEETRCKPKWMTHCSTIFRGQI
ncbi:transposon I factor [Fusarium oxysporum f. sp. phaseoli]